MSPIPPASPPSSRPFDIVVWGATGSVGCLVAEHLLRTYGVGKSVKWAIGGRNLEKLRGILKNLTAIDASAANVPILVADSTDAASLDAMVRETLVVATTVGPYSLYGRELVAACVRNGTAYADITGEVPFVRDMIDVHHHDAQSSGARIVPFCGFDSIPSDLGAMMMNEAMRERYGVPCELVSAFFGESSGQMGGGTAATAANIYEEASKDRRVRKVLADPYALVVDENYRGPDSPDLRSVEYNADIERWTGPFVMAATNTRVVRRTNSLLGYAYGTQFRYHEAMSFPKGPKGYLIASAVTAGLGVAMVALGNGPIRHFLAKNVFPAPGEGPSKEVREKGFFVVRLVGKGTPKNSSTQVTIKGLIRGTSDPGHGETSKMLGESAVCLAKQTGADRSAGGVLTPAAAMGMALVERLRAVGMTFSVE